MLITLWYFELYIAMIGTFGGMMFKGWKGG